MRTIIIFCAFMCSACNAQQQQSIGNSSKADCAISFSQLDKCVYQLGEYTIEVKIGYENLGKDEKSLSTLNVTFNNKMQSLIISPNTTIIDGDIGYLVFTDINFDNTPDLAITTSFGTPNIYLDYWVFDVQQSKYSFVGNYPQFFIDSDAKTLSATVKDNAEKYRIFKWKWSGSKLEAINP